VTRYRHHCFRSTLFILVFASFHDRDATRNGERFISYVCSLVLVVTVSFVDESLVLLVNEML